MIIYVLAILNLLVTFLALRGARRMSAWLLMVVQGPWTVWDIQNHYYPFLALGAVSVALGFHTLCKEGTRAPL